MRGYTGDMKRTGELERPEGLGLRIGLTFAGLAIVYGGLVAALVLSGVWGLLVGAIAALLVVVQVRGSDRLLLSGLKACEVTREEEPELHGVVDRLCVQADLRKPRLVVSASGVPNALAVGGLGGRTTVCVDRRLLDLLEPAELEGVVAHELAHVAHRDVVVMTLAGFFCLLAALLTKLAIHGGHVFVRGAAIVAAPLAWALSTLLIRTLSRYRELAADQTAVRLTGRPSALASALLKVDDAIAGLPRNDLRKVSTTAALAFAPLPRKRLTALLATHPTTQRRVDALGALEVARQHERRTS